MKVLFLTILITVSTSLHACPDLTGTYVCNQGDSKWEHQVQFTKLNRNSFELTWEFESGVSWKNMILADGIKQKSYGSNIYTDAYTTIYCDSTALIITHSIAPSKLGYRNSLTSITSHRIYSLDHKGDLRNAIHKIFSDGESDSSIKTCVRVD